MNKAIIGGTLLVVVLISGALWLRSEPAPGPTPGASSGPALIGGCMDVNGVMLCAYSQSFAQASTTCSFRTEIASSSLIRATAQVINARGGTYDIEFGKSTNQYSTTTTLGNVSGIDAGITVVSSTTPAKVYASAPFNFTVGEYLNIKLGSSSPTVTGKCSALFMSI